MTAESNKDCQIIRHGGERNESKSGSSNGVGFGYNLGFLPFNTELLGYKKIRFFQFVFLK